MQIQHPEIHLQDYIYILKKRLWVVVLAIGLVVAAGLYVTFRAEVLYKATATILIERENPNIVDFKEVMAFDSSTTDYYQTQYQMLKSRSLIESLIEREDLTDDEYLKGMRRGGLRQLIKTQPLIATWLNPFLTDRSFADLIIKKVIEVTPIRNSRLVDVSAIHVDPKRAAYIVNRLVALYIKKNLESRFLISEQARGLLSSELDDLKTQVALADKRLQRYKEEHDLISIPSIHEKDKFLQDARMELIKLESEKARLEKRYLPEHPKHIHLTSQIEAIRENILKEEKKQLGLSRIAIDYEELEREGESARQIYQVLLSRFQEMHSEAKTQASNVVIVDLAKAPERPFKPQPFMNILVALFLGAVLGILLAFFFEYLDATVKVPDDIEKALGLELFGVIPKTSRDKNGPLKGEIFSTQGKPNQATEAFRALRTTLLFKLKHIPGCRTIIVTSPNPSEGKSTVSLNLAASFQQNHLKVLLIDADLRKPKLHVRLGVEHGRGFTDVLEGGIAPNDAILHNAQNLGLDFLISGTQSARPTELLGSKNMKTFMAMICKEYDIILIDSPPYLAVADCAVMSAYADAVLVVTKYQETEKRHLKDIKRRFTELENKLMGVVINQVNVRERDYYYHQYYYYGYGNDPFKN